MASENKHTRRERLPIKMVLPNQFTQSRVDNRRGKPEPFVEVDQKYRARLTTEVRAVRQLVATQAKQTGSAPARVKLRPRAAAKSHRPDSLFSDDSCPIIGAGKLGEVFVKATTSGLDHLARTIQTNQSKLIIKELSTVEVIEPITPQFRRKNRTSEDILRHSPRREDGFVVQVRLFDFGPEDQDDHIKNFRRVVKNRRLDFDHDGYAASSQVFAVHCKKVSDVEAVSHTLGVWSVVPMPTFHSLRPRMLNLQTLPPNLPSSDQVEGGDFPVVVVVDSGISETVPGLKSWIVGRDSSVAPTYRNPTHGTFVAGLVCWPSQLNPTLAGIDNSPCGVFDLQVIPNFDPNYKRDTETITEQEFLITLRTALDQYANQYKVWNLSVGTDEVCSLDEFSSFAEQLDNLQERYKVSFVISAGNYEIPPLLSYPRTGQQLSAGRVTSPADSVLGITVGAVSHMDYPNGGPKRNEPSAFSRHGAGPNYVIKPDLVHYGGGCSTDLTHRHGIRSVGDGVSAENLGTSFATPLVSRTLAQIYHQITPTPSPVLAKALLVHHARDPRNGGRVPDLQENFFGFGMPLNPPYCLECTPYSATLVFEDVLRPGVYQEWDDFPYPPSLRRNGRYYGDISMTVAFAPARGARWGAEYCESHIDASFGVFRLVTKKKDGRRVSEYKGLVPPEHKNPGERYEEYQIERLRKWAPVRTYFGSLGEGGERGERWRLRVRLLTRHSGQNRQPSKPQPYCLIVTIADPKKKPGIYDEMIRTVQTRYKTENLVLRAAARLRTTP
ncbi:MAG: S8 family peptidase [Acidobacteriota bacterium]